VINGYFMLRLALSAKGKEKLLGILKVEKYKPKHSLSCCVQQ